MLLRPHPFLCRMGECRGGSSRPRLRVALELSLITHFYGSLAHAMYLFIQPLRAFYKLFESPCDRTNLRAGTVSMGGNGWAV